MIITERKTKVMFIFNDRQYSLLSAGITSSVLILALFCGQMICGEYTFINGDLYTQCASFAHIFTKKIVEGSNLYYSFNSGIGMNMSLVFAFYVFSPFNILYLFSNGDNINAISVIIFILKAGCAAYTFHKFISYNVGLKNYLSVLFSVGYALASYGLVIANMTPLYDGIYLLPIILVAIKRLVDTKKCFALVLLYSVLFISNFYSGYIVGLTSFGYFVLYILCNEKCKLKRVKTTICYLSVVVCSILISSFVIVPALYEALMQHSIDSNYSFSVVPIWNVVSYLFPFHKCVYFEMTPYLYCGMPALFLVAAFFCNSAVKGKYKITAAAVIVLFIVSLSFGPLYFVAHMFNDPTGYTFRYAYIISFTIASMGGIAIKNVNSIKIKSTIIVDGIMIIIWLIAPILNARFGFYDDAMDVLFRIITIALAFMWGVCFFVYFKHNKMKKNENAVYIKVLAMFATLILFFECGLNSYVILTSTIRQNSAEYKYRVAQANLLVNEVKKVDNSLYRVHYDGLMNQNQACLYDYFSVPLFASSGNQKMKDFMNGIGILTNDFSITDLGDTDLAKLMLNIKYNLIAHVYYTGEDVNYIEQNVTVGFGFMVDSKVAKIELGESVFDNQNKIYSALLGGDVFPYTIYNGNVILEGQGAEVCYDIDGGTIILLEEGCEEGGVFIRVPQYDNIDMYSWLTSGFYTGESDSPIIISPDDEGECGYMQHILNNPHIMKMTKENGFNVIYVALADGIVDEARISECSFASYDDSYIKLLQEKLSQQSINIETFEDGYVTGNITAIEPGICFMSIPYEDGWSAIVDGKAQEITPVFSEAFIGIPLDAGYHEIELRFEAPFSRLGCTLSVLGVIMLMVIGVIEVISCSKKSKI